MKYLSKYKKFVNEENLFIDFDSMSDEDIEDRIVELRNLIGEFQAELTSIFAEKKRRKEDKQRKEELPESVFDLTQEQFDIVFGDAMGQTTYGYDRMQKYAKQLIGCNQTGYNRITNQQAFNISTSYYRNDIPGRIKAIKFLSEMLKGCSIDVRYLRRFDNAVRFDILYGVNENYNDFIIYDKDTKLYYSDGNTDSLENLLNKIDENDKDESDED